jgi:hypothetical protein
MAGTGTNDTDALFTLPLDEFISGRNALAAQLKKAGQLEEANRVKAIAKPTVSAWAANQLYWNHRDAFERLIAAGQRFRQAQAMQLAGKAADMRAPLDERRDALSELSSLAAALLREAGHNPTQDVLRRIGTTLEAISAYTAFPDASRPGRLSADLDPPGFDALSAFEPIAPVAPAGPPRQSKNVTTSEKEAQTRIALAKLSLQDAERSLSDARIRAKSAEVTLKKADADAKAAEMQKREAEERLEQAKATLEQAALLSRRIAAEKEEALKTVAEAERAVQLASEELQSLLKKV